MIDVSVRPQQSPTADSYYNHHIFDNSLTDGGYFHSHAYAIASSRLEVIGGKIPVTTDHFLSPPNSLRLCRLSQTGGAWRAELCTESWPGKAHRLSGDSLSLWCYSEEDIPANHLPMIGLTTKGGLHTMLMQMTGIVPDLPAGRWCQIKIPLAAFPNATIQFDFSRTEKVIFTQGIDGGKPHTLYIDEIKLLVSTKGDMCQPPGGLTAVAYDRHIDLSWPEVTDPAVAYFQIYRSYDGQDFLPIGIQNRNFNRYSDYVGQA